MCSSPPCIASSRTSKALSHDEISRLRSARPRAGVRRAIPARASAKRRARRQANREPAASCLPPSPAAERATPGPDFKKYTPRHRYAESPVATCVSDVRTPGRCSARLELPLAC